MSVIKRRSMLLGGLRLALGRPGALVWTYVANLGIALLFSLRLHAQLASLLDHSFAAQRLNAAFDLGVVVNVFARMSHGSPSPGGTPYLGLPVYLFVYFLLVPGALFTYRLAAPGRLGVLLSAGLSFFWRFVRITLINVLVSGIVLGILIGIQSGVSSYIDEHVVGAMSFYEELPGWVLILLVASLLRLYFDLVEVYTVQLGDQLRPNGKPDKRVWKTLGPAAKTLWFNLPRAFGTFLLLALLGVGAMLFTGRVALHMLAQPRVWPAFLFLQAGTFISLLTRFWQRGAETIVTQDYPLAAAVVIAAPMALTPSPVVLATPLDPLDAQPNPEPAVPSLPLVEPQEPV